MEPISIKTNLHEVPFAFIIDGGRSVTGRNVRNYQRVNICWFIFMFRHVELWGRKEKILVTSLLLI